MSELLYLNGDYLPLDEGRVPVEDRGFLFGDGVYEVVRCYRGQPFRLQEHLERLNASAEAIELALPLTVGDLTQVCDTLLSRTGLSDCTIYIHVTRGVAPRGHAFPKSAVPTVMAFAREVSPPTPAQRANGVPAISVTDDRWGRCQIKSLNLLANVLAKEQAVRAGAFEGLFVREDGALTEGTASNAFCVVDGIVYTHPANNRILHGVTRAAVLEVARDQGRDVREEPRTLDDFLRAGEVFLTGTTVEVLGVSAIDGRKIGGGKPGPVTRGLYEGLLQLVRTRP